LRIFQLIIYIYKAGKILNQSHLSFFV
jgi:hypothetical protein